MYTKINENINELNIIHLYLHTHILYRIVEIYIYNMCIVYINLTTPLLSFISVNHTFEQWNFRQVKRSFYNDKKMSKIHI